MRAVERGWNGMRAVERVEWNEERSGIRWYMYIHV